MQIPETIQRIVRAAREEARSKDTDPTEPKISITTRAGQATFIYERMRNAVEYKEEHLIRRNAIERILRRMISSGHKNNISENLISELIHARYLPNNTIPERKIKELDIIFEKYFTLLGHAPIKDINDSSSLSFWLSGIAATEIDEFLMPPYVMHASINAMYEYLQERVRIEDEINDRERLKQIYIATSRILYKNDNDTIGYHLLLTYYPEWTRANHDLIREIGEHLNEIHSTITQDLNSPIKEKLAPLFRKYVGYFTILQDAIAQDPGKAWSDMNTGHEFEQRVRAICQKQYEKSRASLHRGIKRSIIYLVITKFLLAVVLEIPVDYLLIHKIDYMPLAINLIFPPALLALIALSTKLPDEENTNQMISGINHIIQNQGEIIQMRKSSKRSFFLRAVFTLLYGMLFGISFGLMIYILIALNFTFIGIFIFLLFLSFVSLFAYRIRQSNQEMIVLPPKQGFIRGLWAFFTIPILHAGKWMSTRFAQINIFIFALDFIIEAPFKAFIKVIEEWMNYVHEKKEEI
ncbi:MAG: hypothetical protein CO042_03945 [Parcubacteria group bacterium CG_4_9_14_0_2_um_filter_41_8]|nr:MAG: hypothetical protein AUJ34_02100 [Parcubacteria group bacterium CG1_02_41_12]PIQ80390.1 MAG: hypothetical protein COV79_00685 [Parcubacteria group bacterium CG11_big_fil_rev_8_21_14_0_20_41_14]PIR57257.1 MAG: hypothetical protein COU72_01870 [Parcubacteria group bacterium CG10_big_fil_rev_8_21_14_0_10_41_35]PJC40413.1 MAG: hypothetical protein CO042_03945 [Parcubacteria group bacterium CG_4_9_14_0_2_um_filter_41_8]